MYPGNSAVKPLVGPPDDRPPLLATGHEVLESKTAPRDVQLSIAEVLAQRLEEEDEGVTHASVLVKSHALEDQGAD